MQTVIVTVPSFQFIYEAPDKQPFDTGNVTMVNRLWSV